MTPKEPGLLLFQEAKHPMDLNTVREQLSAADTALVEALALRQRLVREVARVKAPGSAALSRSWTRVFASTQAAANCGDCTTLSTASCV